MRDRLRPLKCPNGKEDLQKSIAEVSLDFHTRGKGYLYFGIFNF
jgi:hypothetical protein